MRRRFTLPVVAVVLAAQLVLALFPLRSALAQTEVRYFPETQHYVRGLFLQYWTQHGGLAQQGYPLTEEFQETSTLDNQVYTVQYFERAVFEHHPEHAGTPYEVLLTQLGTYELHSRYPGGPPPSTPRTDNPRVFSETGHTIGGKFRAYWESHGGLAQQGYPLTDEFTEISTLDHKPYTVQYFERAIFEWHPEHAGTPYEVLLTQLGKYQLDSRYPNGSNPAAAPAPPPTAAQPTATPTAGAAIPPTPTRVGTNCEAVAEARKAPKAHTGPVEISNIQPIGEEYVTIHNLGSDPVDLSGWTLRDKNEVDQHYHFPAGTTLVGSASLDVYTHPGHPYTFDRTSPIWNDCGDAAELINAAGQTVATYAYGTHCLGNDCL